MEHPSPSLPSECVVDQVTPSVFPHPSTWEQDLPLSQLTPFPSPSHCCLNKLHSFVFFKWTFSMKEKSKNKKTKKPPNFRSQPRLCVTCFFFPWDLWTSVPLIFLTCEIYWIFCRFLLLSMQSLDPLGRLLDLLSHSLQKPPALPSDFYPFA